ncbi:MAG: hypothetical protein R6V32_02480 [Bacteroidales bacterium]
MREIRLSPEGDAVSGAEPGERKRMFIMHICNLQQPDARLPDGQGGRYPAIGNAVLFARPAE